MKTIVMKLLTRKTIDGYFVQVDRQMIRTVKVHNFLIPGLTFLALFRDHSAIFRGIPADISNDTF